ncbi:PKHD-type hydroxylase [Carex littledalei]|uniref:PKHD-type hydroxylase n=1 Tax=Carex littledalei TaxID=544730 RepID=A0A833VXI7_9POAL|nr:PKHD-type hydroxylase [Carex littledalei]
MDGAIERREELIVVASAGNGTASSRFVDRRLRISPNMEHRPERYDDLTGEVEAAVFSSLERHLPPTMLDFPRDAKFQYMMEVLSRYLPEGERTKVQKHKEYRKLIIKEYKPLHRELFSMNPAAFFLPSFFKAVSDNTEESIRSIMSEPSPGIYTFPMLQPSFCQMLIEEVEHIENTIRSCGTKIMKPNTMNKYGAVLDDFGFDAMLTKLMEDFLSPISKVYYPDVGGTALDSHHGFVVEYGNNRDLDLGFHVDDSEVTLNVCLGKQFIGGELFFRGVRCDKHVNSDTSPEEIFDYNHVPGQAVLHRGRHRHGARATTAGHRINLLLWCRSSTFRELKKYQKDFSSWCGECQREKIERQRQSIAATKMQTFLRSSTGSVI